MKQLLQLEEVMLTALGIAALYYQPIHISWWLWPIVFLSPDIAMLGYAINTKAGAAMYNLFHHKGIAVLAAAIGFFTHQPVLMFVGILLFFVYCCPATEDSAVRGSALISPPFFLPVQ